MLIKFALLPQVEEKLSSIEKVNDEVEAFWSLKRVMQLHDERMIDSFKDHALNSCVRLLALSQHHVFLKAFHSVNATLIFLLH